MKKNWERSAKVFDDKLMFDDGLVYSTFISIQSKHGEHFPYFFVKFFKYIYI
jgi:hypothetical protein